MTFGESVKTVFSKYAVFDGRARRSEYWYFVLFTCILDAVLGVLALILGQRLGTILLDVVSLAIFLPSLGVAVRRLHDVGKSGWWVLIAITGIGAILLIVWMVQDSQPGSNEYGENPKGELGAQDIAHNASRWEEK